jgi:hypothetical protein
MPSAFHREAEESWSGLLTGSVAAFFCANDGNVEIAAQSIWLDFDFR